MDRLVRWDQPHLAAGPSVQLAVLGLVPYSLEVVGRIASESQPGPEHGRLDGVQPFVVDGGIRAF